MQVSNSCILISCPSHPSIPTFIIYGQPLPSSDTQPLVGVYFTALYRALASSRTSLLDHTQRRATVDRTPLNE